MLPVVCFQFSDNLPVHAGGESQLRRTNMETAWLTAAPSQFSYATAACLIGLPSVLLFPIAPLALLFGILALRDIRRHPEKTGTSRAWLGIVTGTLGTLILLALGIMLLVVYLYQMFETGS